MHFSLVFACDLKLVGSESNVTSRCVVNEQVEKRRDVPQALARAAALPPGDSPCLEQRHAAALRGHRLVPKRHCRD